MLPPTSVVPVRVGEREEAVQERVEICEGQVSREHQAEQRDAWRGAHGRQVAQVHGQGLVTHGLHGRPVTSEVHAFNQAVGGHDLLHAPFGLQHRRIVSDAEAHERWHWAEPLLESRDEFAFAEGRDARKRGQERKCPALPCGEAA